MAARFIKVYTAIARDEKIAELSNDAARWAFIAILAAAKEQRPAGSFSSRKHLEACVSGTVAKHIAELLRAGLLAIDGDRIGIKAWARWQVDPTTAERSARWRATHTQRSETVTITARDRETGIQGNRETGRFNSKSIKAPQSISEILGGRK